jgi:hypothetical protein
MIIPEANAAYDRWQRNLSPTINEAFKPLTNQLEYPRILILRQANNGKCFFNWIVGGLVGVILIV